MLHQLRDEIVRFREKTGNMERKSFWGIRFVLSYRLGAVFSVLGVGSGVEVSIAALSVAVGLCKIWRGW